MEHETREEFNKIRKEIHQQLNRKKQKYMGLTVEEVSDESEDSDVDLDKPKKQSQQYLRKGEGHLCDHVKEGTNIDQKVLEIEKYERWLVEREKQWKIYY